MKSNDHLEDVSNMDVFQIIVRFESRKILNVFHNMNTNTEIVFIGDRSIHIDM